jgi:putative inorganic carbon (HCO3(-)) transporter
MGLALVLTYIGLNLLSPADIFPGLAPFRPMLILALISVPPLVFARLSSPEIGELRTQLILVIMFFGYACASWLPHGGFGANLRTLAELSPNVIAYFMGVVFLRSPFRLQLLRTILVFVAVFVIANALLEIPYVHATGDSAAYVMAARGLDNSNEARIRGLGMLNDPNNFGQYLLMVLPMLFVGKKEAGPGPRYLLAIPIAVLFMVGLYFTGSRGAAMGGVVLLGLFLTRRFKAAGAVVTAALGALLLLAINALNSISNRTISMSGGMDRLALWSDGMAYFKSSPLWGIGIRGYTERSFMTAHNSYLLCAAELGMVGYFLWMSIVVVTLIQLSRIPKVVGASNPLLGRWAVALRLSLGVYMFTSFFLSRTYDLPLFLLLGMSGAVIAAAGGDKAIPLRGTKWPVWSLGICVSVLALIYAMLRLRVVV